MTEDVSVSTCQKCRQDMDKQLDRDEDRLNNHSDEIDKLTSISDKLSILVEGQQDQIKELKGLYKELNDQFTKILLTLATKVEDNEKSRQSDKEDTQSDKPTATQFWMSPGGLWIIRGGIIILILIVAAAIGSAIPEDIWTSIFN